MELKWKQSSLVVEGIVSYNIKADILSIDIEQDHYANSLLGLGSVLGLTMKSVYKV